VHCLATTIKTWWPAVEAAITTGNFNARSRGHNQLAKHQGRNAFSFRNVENHRRRIRALLVDDTTRQGGGRGPEGAANAGQAVGGTTRGWVCAGE
jgi:hypothetical protein